MKPLFSSLLAFLLAFPAPAAPKPAPKPVPDPPPLSVDFIMRGPGLYGYSPRAVRWSGDGRRVYFEWKLATDAPEADYDTWVVERDGSGLKRLTRDQSRLAPPAACQENRERTRCVFSERGDLFLYDRATDTPRQLTRTSESELNPRFTRDGLRVAFTRGANLYTLALENGFIDQLTDIRPAAAPAAAPTGPIPGQGRTAAATAAQSADTERKGTASQEELKKLERALLDAVTQRARKREEDEARRKQDNPRRPWTLAARQSVSSLLLSPDEAYVMATVSESSADAKSTVVPNYVTESAYTETIPSRTKVGDTQGRSRQALASTATGQITWLDHGQKEKQGDREVERPVSLTNPRWSDDGAKLALLGRSADNKDRWIFAADPATGKLRVLFHHHDDAWVDGPGSSLLLWLPDNERLVFQAETTGWSHLYSVAWAGGEPKALTRGSWEVGSAELTRDRTELRFISSEQSPYERHVYRLSTAGGTTTRVTSETGSHEAVASPDESRLAVLYSSTTTPPELYLMDNRPGAPMTRVTTSPTPEFTSRTWLDAPIVTVPARDGAEVPARLYLPRNWKPGGPAVIFVHGAGYLQNVHRWWSSYAREYLFNQLLMERGFLVVDIDYRGSAGHGRDWRTAIASFMGGQDLDDHVDAARWLVRRYGVDEHRIGLYGGSYGGFITLMALFNQPDVFAAGAALRPVTDWAHYNHGYTSNILDLPQKDRLAYRRSSPLYHAGSLKGSLLICHGMVDTNVHFQDTVRLVQKLIELRKQNWELAVYPVEDHAFVQAASWTDEYRRILKLFETTLKK